MFLSSSSSDQSSENEVSESLPQTIYTLPVFRNDKDSRKSGSFSRVGIRYSSEENQGSFPVKVSASCADNFWGWM